MNTNTGVNTKTTTTTSTMLSNLSLVRSVTHDPPIEDLQEYLDEIKILLSEINEPSSYANATKAPGRMY
jgi:hypothetical protein